MVISIKHINLMCLMYLSFSRAAFWLSVKSDVLPSFLWPSGGGGGGGPLDNIDGNGGGAGTL